MRRDMLAMTYGAIWRAEFHMGMLEPSLTGHAATSPRHRPWASTIHIST